MCLEVPDSIKLRLRVSKISRDMQNILPKGGVVVLPALLATPHSTLMWKMLYLSLWPSWNPHKVPSQPSPP
jgi:hypothetical protein